MFRIWEEHEKCVLIESRFLSLLEPERFLNLKHDDTISSVVLSSVCFVNESMYLWGYYVSINIFFKQWPFFFFFYAIWNDEFNFFFLIWMICFNAPCQLYFLYFIGFSIILQIYFSQHLTFLLYHFRPFSCFFLLSFPKVSRSLILGLYEVPHTSSKPTFTTLYIQ